MKMIGYVGTYTNKDSKGIYRFVYDNQMVSNTTVFANVKDPKYLCFADNNIACVNRFEQGSGVTLYNKDGKKLDELNFEEIPSCFVMYEDGYLYTANYHEGTVSKIQVKGNNLSLVNQLKVSDEAGCHQVLSHKGNLYVPCLKLDEILVLTKDLEQVDVIHFEKGAGCRHAAFSEDGLFMFVTGELSNSVFVVDLAQRRVIQKVRLEGSVSENRPSAIQRVGNYLYVAVRGSDTIAVLEIIGVRVIYRRSFSVYGKHPRDIRFVNDICFVCNKDSDAVSILKIENGNLKTYEGHATCKEAVSIILTTEE